MWWAAIIGGLVEAVGTFVGRTLVSLSIGYITYQGFDAGMDYIKARIVAAVGSLGAQAIAFLGGCEVGTAVNVVLSAMMVRLLIDGLQSGSVKKMRVK